MGIAPGENLDQYKKNINDMMNKYFKDFHYKDSNILRADGFITIIVTAKETIAPEVLDVSPGTPLIFKIIKAENENYLKYSEEYNNIKLYYSNLQSNPNILPILKLQLLKEENLGVVMRQYIKYNLDEAFYYMSCVSEIEKKWICFQLLHGLNQIHSKTKCHGDIKPKNILMTSKLSVFFSDISVYKPVYLSIEELQSYNNYFYSNPNDINKPCYLSPERFVYNSKGIEINKSHLTPEMDIFSLGVVMSEIFLDKTGLFTQLDIISLKNGEISARDKLDGIRDIHTKKMLEQMIDINPKKRIKLGDALKFFSDNLCPAPITKFIVHLNLMMIEYEYYKNDLLVGLIYKHFQQIWKSLCINNKKLTILGENVPILKNRLNKNLIVFLLKNKDNNIYHVGREFPLAFIPNENKEKFIESNINEDFFIENHNFDNNNDCTIIIIKYLLSCLDNIKYISTYFVIFEMIFNFTQILIANSNTDIILEFIVPYYIKLFKSKSSRVKIEAFNSLINILNIINYEELILNELNYNYFNNYVFEKIYQIFSDLNQIEVKCAIMSRIEEIIKLENNFLYSYLNTINFISNQKKKEKKFLNQSLYNSMILHQSLNHNINNDNKNKNEVKINYNDVYKRYLENLNDFKNKLKNIIESVMVNKDIINDSLKLIVIQKYKEICMFLGNYNENQNLFAHLFISFNGNNYYIQKEIIKICPSLILLFGKRLYYDYFLEFVKKVCEDKNSELIIIEVIDVITFLTKMNLISHDDDYSRIYKILIPYFVHPNYLLRYKLYNLFHYILLDEKNTKCKLYISLYHNIKNILLNSKLDKNEEKKITIINIIDKEIIKSIKELYYIPREIFLLYKYNVEFKENGFEPLLQNITKIKKKHYTNVVKESTSLQKSLGLISKNDMDNIKIKKFYDIIIKELNKYLIYKGYGQEKNSAFLQSSFINKLTILFNELNRYDKNKKSFMDKLYSICGNPENIFYSKILYLIKVLDYKLDTKNISTANLMQTNDDNFIYNSSFNDFMLIKGSIFRTINTKNTYDITVNDKAKLCYELNINESESIVKLIPVNNILGKQYLDMFISISDEGIIRLHMIYRDPSFDDIYIIKNRAEFSIDVNDGNLKQNNISYIEKPNKIIILIAIKKKIQLVNIELSEDENDKDSFNSLEKSYIINNIECTSEKEIIAIENIYNNNKNYLALGNIDNTISFFNYIENKIDYINNSTSFSASYGYIELIMTLSISNNILVTTSNGFIIVYDYYLRLFTYVYSFSNQRKIKEILEYKDNDYNESDNKIELIYLLTEDNEIILWNLSLLKPSIIYKFIKLEKIEDHKNIHIEKPELKKLSLETNPQNENNPHLIKLDFSELNLKKENQIIKMNIPHNYKKECSFPLMIVGDKLGIVYVLDFSKENLDKIKNKQNHKNNKFNQVVITNENEIKNRNDSKFKKTYEVYINKVYFSAKKSNKKLNENQTDLLFMKDIDKNKNYIITSYDNGIIKLWIL